MTKTYIALLRGVNAGGHNILPMKDFGLLLRELGLQHVRTYIQSGNAVFEHDSENTGALANLIAGAIRREFGFEPLVIVLEMAGLERAMASNPFPEAESDPKTLHLFFPGSPPVAPDIDRLERIKLNGERFVLGEAVFYLHAPNGIGKSKVAAQAGKAMGVSLTARNWRTVSRLLDMAREGAG